MRGGIMLRPFKLRFRASPAWRNVAGLNTHHMVIPQYMHTSIHLCTSVGEVAQVERKPTSFLISCYKCQSRLDAANRYLYHNGKFVSIQCKQCRSHTISKRWRCSCDTFWHLCSTHAPEGYLCSSNRTQGAVSRTSASVKRGSSSMDNMPSDLDYAAPDSCVRTQIFDLPPDPRTAQRKALPALVRQVRARGQSQSAPSSSSFNPHPPEVIPLEHPRPDRGNGGRGKRGLKRTISDYEAIERINRMRNERGKELGDP